MVLSRDDLRNQLKRREIAPVYVLFGAETYLRDIAAKTISNFAFSEGDFRDFNETVVSLGSGGSLQEAFAAANQLPMMAARRVVRINDVRVSATGYRDTITEEHESVLATYFSNPSPHSIVIFVADDLNGVRKMGKFLREKTCSVEFKPLDDRQFAEWAQREISEAGAEIDEITLRHLLTRVGPDVRRLSNEVAKLAAAAMPSTQITADLVDALVPRSRELNNFDLTDHLIAGRKRQVMTALGQILDDGAEPLALLGLISYNFRRLLIAKELMAKSVPRPEIASAVKLFGRGQDDFLAAARRAEKAKLVRALDRLAKTDLAIKTSLAGGGPAGARMQIEMLVCELATL